MIYAIEGVLQIRRKPPIFLLLIAVSTSFIKLHEAVQ
jgi:hypothetical protein